ncbi:MAG: hypothetical protein ACYDCQ_19885 [Dehalococcoidia bacterium]
MADEHRTPSFDWMNADVERVRALPGEHGMTLRAINIGRYGDVPDRWPHLDDTPRGASSGGPVTFASSYSIFDKADVWSENAADLYEEAIQDRWSSASDVPWGTLEPLPNQQERAVDQICTRLSEQGFAAQQVIGKWLERIAYGFLEVKSFLATQVYDAGRQCEAFRKRALANGGGLGIETPGIWNRLLVDSLKWTEFVAALDILQASADVELLETLAEHAFNDAERTLYSLTARDRRRHLAYGEGHLSFHLAKLPERRDQLNVGFFRAESALVNDLVHDRPFIEAMVIVLGGAAGEEAGWERLLALHERQAEAYLATLDRAGMAEHRDTVYGSLRRPLAGMVGAR